MAGRNSAFFISGQNSLKETTRFTGLNLRTYGQQEADIVKMVSSITKYSHMLTEPGKIREVMYNAIQAACSGRKGPVWIDIPIDLQSSRIEAPSVVLIYRLQKNQKHQKMM